MNTIPVTAGTRTLLLDMAGKVIENAHAVGTWTTNAADQVEILFADATRTLVDLAWHFDENNHLRADDFDFHAIPGMKPLIRTVDSVLLIRPDRNSPFEFRLHPQWTMTAAHDLELTIAGLKSRIDGYLFDSLGRFRYHFFDKLNRMSETILGFRGEWVNGAAPGTLSFRYDKGTFELPATVAVDPATNQLTYAWQKSGHTFRVQFAGTFTYRNLELTYAIERTRQSDGEPTTLRFGAVLNSKSASGSLDFSLTNQSGAVTSTTLSLTGGFVSQFRNGRLELGFRFSQQRTSGVAVNTLLLSGQLTHRNGSFAWTCETNGHTTTLGISMQQMQLGDARAQGGLNVTLENGRIAGVRALFGITF